MNYAKGLDIKHIIINALREDIGPKDVTTESLIPKNKIAQAVLIAKEKCVVCGLDIAGLVLRLKDKNIKFKPLVKDGDALYKGRILARISGKARSILTAERVALNFLSHLSGIATGTKKFINQVKPYRVKIMDTRKTTPGLRILEKYAVRIGGGYNHRLGLDEMVLIKDNHTKIIGKIKNLAKFKRKYKVEIEVKNLKEFRQALNLKPDIIMLDNMRPSDIKKAVRIRNKLTLGSAPKLEVSGGITLNNVKKIASCGVEMISVGALTHSVDSVDISLDLI